MKKNNIQHHVIVLSVNDEEHSVAVKDGETLLEVLREKLGLTGTKKGCNMGVCGVCTILLDGEPKNSCLLLASACQDHKITTIEGIAVNGKLHPIQRAFINHGAVQCGYCSPGMILSAYALIQKNPDPSDEDIKDALSGNLCRCTGYTKILEAVKNWKKYKTTEEPPLHSYDLKEYDTVGRSVPRVDAADKVSGRAKYTADFSFENMLYGRILTSPIAHGRILSSC